MVDGVERGRMTAGYEGPVVVFVIGMRMNSLVRVTRWWPAFRAMGRMLGELGADPDGGFLGGEAMFRSWRVSVLIQYWRSFEALHAYAHAGDRHHQPAWPVMATSASFTRPTSSSRGGTIASTPT